MLKLIFHAGRVQLVNIHKTILSCDLCYFKHYKKDIKTISINGRLINACKKCIDDIDKGIKLEVYK